MKNNIDTLLNDMREKGETERKIGDVKVIRYNPTPKEQLENMGKAIETKKKIEHKSDPKGSFVGLMEAIKSWEDIANHYKNKLNEGKK